MYFVFEILAPRVWFFFFFPHPQHAESSLGQESTLCHICNQSYGSENAGCLTSRVLWHRGFLELCSLCVWKSSKWAFLFSENMLISYDVFYLVRVQEGPGEKPCLYSSQIKGTLYASSAVWITSQKTWGMRTNSLLN